MIRNRFRRSHNPNPLRSAGTTLRQRPVNAGEKSKHQIPKRTVDCLHGKRRRQREARRTRQMPRAVAVRSAQHWVVPFEGRVTDFQVAVSVAGNRRLKSLDRLAPGVAKRKDTRTTSLSSMSTQLDEGTFFIFYFRSRRHNR